MTQDHKKNRPSLIDDNQLIHDDIEFPEESNRMMVPRSFNASGVGIEKHVISRQISKMDEPGLLSNEDMEERGILFAESSDRILVNRFRDLRTRLLEMSKGNNFSLLVTSITEGGGGSFVALNLASAFSFDKSKTALIVDCNLREPSLHQKLDFVPEHGLTDFLDNPEIEIGSIIYPSGLQRLRVIPAGTRSEYPGEFFSSFRMKQFLGAVRKRYPDRFVILDAPSLEESPDARILSELCDYTMMVVPHAKVTEAQITKAVSTFSEDKFVGVVLNG